MAKTRIVPPATESVVSLIGVGMRVVGDCDSSHTIRIEGAVEGTVRAEKGVVIGKGGRVTGDIHAADAKIAGTVKGALRIESRLELESTAVVDGEIRAARVKLDEGGTVNGTVAVGRQAPASQAPASGNAPAPASKDAPAPASKGAPAETAKEKPAKNGSLFGVGKPRKARG